MNRPTILDLDLVVVPREPAEEMFLDPDDICVNFGESPWGAFKRHYSAMLSASPYPTAWDEVRKYVEGMETQLKAHMADDYGFGPAGMSKADVARTIAHNATVRAEAAEARIAELENRLADAESEPVGTDAEGILRQAIKRAEKVCKSYGGYMPALATLVRILADELADAYPDDTNGGRAARAYMEGK